MLVFQHPITRTMANTPPQKTFWTRISTITWFNAIAGFLMLALYSFSLGFAAWKDAALTRKVSLPFMGCIYGCACMWVAYRWRAGKADMHAVNAVMAFTTSISGSAVFVTMSWLSDDTYSQRAWAYTAQLLAVVFAAGAAYVNAAAGIAKTRRQQDRAGPLRRDHGVASHPVPPAPLNTPSVSVFNDASSINVHVGDSRIHVCTHVVTLPDGRHLEAGLLEGQMVLPTDTQPMWVKQIGSSNRTPSYVDHGVIQVRM